MMSCNDTNRKSQDIVHNRVSGYSIDTELLKIARFLPGHITQCTTESVLAGSF